MMIIRNNSKVSWQFKTNMQKLYMNYKNVNGVKAP